MSSWTDTWNDIHQALRGTTEANPVTAKELSEATGYSEATIRDHVRGEVPSRREGRKVVYWSPIEGTQRKNITFGEYARNVRNTLFGLGYDMDRATRQVTDEYNQRVFEGYMRLDGSDPLNAVPKHSSQVALEVKRWIEAVADEDDREAMESKGLQQK
jgi:hypothetical protein